MPTFGDYQQGQLMLQESASTGLGNVVQYVAVGLFFLFALGVLVFGTWLVLKKEEIQTDLDAAEKKIEEIDGRDEWTLNRLNSGTLVLTGKEKITCTGGTTITPTPSNDAQTSASVLEITAPSTACTASIAIPKPAVRNGQVLHVIRGTDTTGDMKIAPPAGQSFYDEAYSGKTHVKMSKWGHNLTLMSIEGQWLITSLATNETPPAYA